MLIVISYDETKQDIEEQKVKLQIWILSKSKLIRYMGVKLEGMETIHAIKYAQRMFLKHVLVRSTVYMVQMRRLWTIV
jgi:hypothetical protein